MFHRYLGNRAFQHLFVSSNLLFLLVAPAFAGGVPKQLYNKTITIIWVESIREWSSDDGLTHTPQTTQQRVVYVSSLGRIFERMKAENYWGMKLVETAPENARVGKFSFQGNSLTGIAGNRGVARRVVASFDRSYSSCTATITIGKSSAEPEWTGMNGKTYTVEEVKVGQISCTITDGNGLSPEQK